MKKGGWVYITANQTFGTLYIGVTSDIERRVAEHRAGTNDGFTKRYHVSRLVWLEWHDDIRDAIQRETSVKRWSRAWKIDLIMASNPEWHDLATGGPGDARVKPGHDGVGEDALPISHDLRPSRTRGSSTM